VPTGGTDLVDVDSFRPAVCCAVVALVDGLNPRIQDLAKADQGFPNRPAHMATGLAQDNARPERTPAGRRRFSGAQAPRVLRRYG